MKTEHKEEGKLHMGHVDGWAVSLVECVIQPFFVGFQNKELGDGLQVSDLGKNGVRGVPPEAQ